jgi:type 1 glutamine amidotransferase
MISRAIPADVSEFTRKRVLLLHGGWRGHAPAKFADFAEQELLEGYDVVRSRSLDDLNVANLKGFDLILPIWTFGSLTAPQQRALIKAVHGGLGYVGWHGNASSFLECRPHKLLLGGQFVAHPGGNQVRYSVSFHREDYLVSDLSDFTVVSEQYYLLIDPAVKVLAETTIDGGPMHWLHRVRMPVAWKRCADQGRVFYCALGHTVDVLRKRPVMTLLRRALAWAARGSELPF